jgi:predicted ester cyclase
VGHKDELRQAYGRLIAAVAANDEDALGGVMSPDIVDRSAGPDQLPGLAGIVLWMRGFHAGLSDFSGSIEDTVVEGDKIVGRLTWRGTHTGPFLGMAATGKTIEFASIHILRFDNGFAVEWWGVPDIYGALTGMGARFELGPP